MSTTQSDPTVLTPQPGDATIPMRFEVTTLPVADVDRSRAFYERLGWRLDIDRQFTDRVRGVQFTPPDGNLWVLQEVTERIPGRV